MTYEYYVEWDYDANFYSFWPVDSTDLYYKHYWPGCKKVKLSSTQLTDYMNAYHQVLEAADPIYTAIED